jgi:hypothetical protein
VRGGASVEARGWQLLVCLLDALSIQFAAAPTGAQGSCQPLALHGVCNERETECTSSQKGCVGAARCVGWGW